MPDKEWKFAEGDTVKVQNLPGDLRVDRNGSGIHVRVHGNPAQINRLSVTCDNGVVTIKGLTRIQATEGGFWQRLRFYFKSSNVPTVQQSSVTETSDGGYGHCSIEGAGTGLTVCVDAPRYTRVLASNVNGVSAQMNG